MENRIKCGKCQCEYNPRPKQFQSGTADEKDYSCPVCGYGQFKENVGTGAPGNTKRVLLD